MSFSVSNLNTQNTNLAYDVQVINCGLITIPFSCVATAAGTFACYNTVTGSPILFELGDILIDEGLIVNSFTGGTTTTVSLGLSLTSAGAITTSFINNLTATTFANLVITQTSATISNTTGKYMSFILTNGTAVNAQGIIQLWKRSLLVPIV